MTDADARREAIHAAEALDPLTLSRYRVEWRLYLPTRWTRMRTFGGYSEAAAYAREMVTEHRGQVRVIRQEVVLVDGLGATVEKTESRDPSDAA